MGEIKLQNNKILLNSSNNEIYFEPIFEIGDDAFGGKIAYIYQPGDPGYVEGEQHGFVAQPSDLSSFSNKKQWGCDGTEISGADGTSLGTGKQNTIDIVNGCSETNRAARLCYESNVGGYNDWFLPSIDELNKLYLNQILIGGFMGIINLSIPIYWSSSEVFYGQGIYRAWQQYFAGGSSAGLILKGTKNNPQYVRAIRYF